MSGAEIPIVMSVIGGVSSLVGSGLSIYGGYEQAEAAKDVAAAEAAALKRKAEFERALKNEQADEILKREQINARYIEKEVPRLQGEYATAFAASGRQGGIGGMVRIKRQIAESLTLSRQDAEYKARMLRAGADIDVTLATEAGSRLISGAERGYTGTILGGVGSALPTLSAWALANRPPQRQG